MVDQAAGTLHQQAFNLHMLKSAKGLRFSLSYIYVMSKILSEKTLIPKPLHIQQAELQDKNGRYERTRIQREEGATLLMYNTSNETIIMTRQYRYAVHDKTPELLEELPAGKVDKQESPASTIVRECLEETGYQINEKDLVHLGSFFMSPGYTSELLHLFAIKVESRQRKEKGGGLEEEHESIEVFEIPLAEFRKKIRDRSYPDAKTQLAGMIWLSLNF